MPPAALFGRPSQAVQANTDPALQVVAWTQGVQTTDIRYAIFESSGAIHSMPDSITRFAQGAYFDLNLIANPDGSATIGSR